jgi:hypothetical protein
VIGQLRGNALSKWLTTLNSSISTHCRDNHATPAFSICTARGKEVGESVESWTDTEAKWLKEERMGKVHEGSATLKLTLTPCASHLAQDGFPARSRSRVPGGGRGLWLRIDGTTIELAPWPEGVTFLFRSALAAYPTCPSQLTVQMVGLWIDSHVA